MKFIIGTLLAALAISPTRAQMFISTGNSSGVRIYSTGSNDWLIDPSAGRFDVRVNGGGVPVASIDATGAVTSSSQTLTGNGLAPFNLTTSSGVHILSGVLKLEKGASIQYGDGTVATSTSFTSTLTYRGANGLGIGPGLMVLVSSANFTTVTVATVTLPAPYNFFYVTASLNNATATNYTLYLTMGGDTASNYMWSTFTWDSGTGQVVCNPAAYYVLNYTAGNATYFKAGTWAMSNIQVQIPATGTVLFTGETVGTNPTSNPTRTDSQCVYTGANQRTLSFMIGTPTSCTALGQAANAMTGTIYVYAMPF